MHDKHQKPNLFRWLGGTTLGIVAFSIVWAVVSGMGIPIMGLLPGAFGLLKELTPADIISVQIPGNTEVLLTESMQYFVFSQRRVALSYNIGIKSVATSEFLTLEKETDPIYYETNLIQGMLLYRVSIQQPGLYRIVENEVTTPQKLLLVPNVARHNTIVILLFYGILALVLIVIIAFYYRRLKIEDMALAQKKATKWERWAEMRKTEDECTPGDMH